MKSDERVTTKMDMAAASRVARRVNLTEIRLTHVDAERVEGPGAGELSPDLTHNHRTVRWDSESILVLSQYALTVSSADTNVLSVHAVYELTYELMGDGPVDQGDLEHFASANGAYHSWPFVRELLFGLTGRMGLPPFTLPVMAFFPRAAEVTSGKDRS